MAGILASKEKAKIIKETAVEKVAASGGGNIIA